MQSKAKLWLCTVRSDQCTSVVCSAAPVDRRARICQLRLCGLSAVLKAGYLGLQDLLLAAGFMQLLLKLLLHLHNRIHCTA